MNLVKTSHDLRNNYLAKLIHNKIWTPTEKKRVHNSLVIFDWDDTLLPTSYLSPYGIFKYDLLTYADNSEKIKKLDELVFNLLSISIKNSDTYIITNAQKGWVEFSAKKSFPKTYSILGKIKIISARDYYEKTFPGDLRQWKIQTFLKFAEILDNKLITNLICLGDSTFEMDAAKYLYKRFSNAYIKTIKFKETPNLNDLIKQLNLVTSKFSLIFSSIKNISIRLEKIKKDENVINNNNLELGF